MTQEDIIRMAREAGLIVDANQSGFDSVEAFAAIVRAHERRHVRWAIKEALTQPEQEPVGQIGEDKHGLVGHIYDDRKVKIGDKLYTTPPLPVQPQRTWVGLTDEEKLDLLSDAKGMGGHICGDGQLFSLLEEHEAKLKEKNT
jgi:hypothetical protein